MNDRSPRPRPPHPLAVALIERLRGRTGARVLEIGAGSGRNTRALREAGYTVVSLEDAGTERCAGAIASHALLHGTPASLAHLLERISHALEHEAPLFGTFGSIADARYGQGEQREPHVFAPVGGDEKGVAHVFFDRERLEALLKPHFVIESLEEVDVDAIAGGWAHEREPLRGAVHWFARLRRL